MWSGRGPGRTRPRASAGRALRNGRGTRCGGGDNASRGCWGAGGGDARRPGLPSRAPDRRLGCECLGPRPDAARCRCLVHHIACHLRIGVEFFVPLLGCLAADDDESYNLSNFCDPEVDQRVKRALDLQETDRYRAAQAFAAVDRDLVDMAPLIPYATGRFVAFASTGRQRRGQPAARRTPVADVGPLTDRVG